MKKLLAILVAVNFGSAQAYLGTWNDPLRGFDASKNQKEKITLNWRTVDNVVEACNAHSKSLGFTQPLGPLTACSFWQGSSCTIITSKTPTMHEIGHELRHCYQGNWH